jgi:hypothetical protein
VPLLPLAVVSGCVWHTPPGQCRTLIAQCSAAGARAPSSASVALPANAITSPTAKVAPTAGASIVGTGAWFVTGDTVVNVQIAAATIVFPAASATAPAPIVAR